MGCCVSSCERKNRNHKRTSLEKNHHSSGVSKSPPTPDEELVKEVLTETPEPEPEPEPEIKALNCDPEPEPDKCRILGSPGKPVLVQNSTSEDDIANTVVDEVIYRVNKSQGYNSNFGTNKCNNNTSDQKTRLSPVRRAYPSPPRRYSGTGTGPGTGRVGLRRDVSGENSGRRSQSPGTRSNVGRSVSARRGGMSPGRVRMVHGPDDEIRDEWAGPRESLENPLVSLECFIFL